MSDVTLTTTLPGATGPSALFVSQGLLRLRGSGNWTSYLEGAFPVAPLPGTPATLTLRRDDGTLDTFVGTVRRASSNPGSELLTVTVVGGAGRLLTPLPPLDHVDDTGQRPVTVGAVARAICDAAGEVLAPGVEAALDAFPLARWHRATDTTAAVALDLVAYFAGLTWRVLPSGFVWMGVDAFPPADARTMTAATYWTGIDGDDGATLYSVRGAPLLVGTTIGSVQAIDVEYVITGSTLAKVRGAVPGDPPHVPDLDIYRGTYAGKVVAQRANGTIDVVCDDARVGDLRAVQLRVGLPGALVTLDLTVETRVRIAFDGASPAGAYATALDQDSSAVAAVALVGDAVSVGAIEVFAPGGAPCAIRFSPPEPPGGANAYPPGSTQITGFVYGPGSQQVRLR